MYTPRFGLGHVSELSAEARSRALLLKHDDVRPSMATAPSRSSDEAKALERMLRIIGIAAAGVAIAAFAIAALGA
jgi:hypothetical protein